MELGKNYIGYTYTSSGSKTFRTFNPKLNSENTFEFTEATPEEINTAVNLAWDAFKSYRKISGKSKAKFLNLIADELALAEKDIIEMYCQESGLPEGRAKGELGRTIFQLRTFAQLVEDDHWVEANINSNAHHSNKPDLRQYNIPLGPVAVFGASNFPLAYSTAGGDTASALASGCPVIVKSHPMHAATGSLVASAIVKAAKKTNMPNGVFSNLNSSDTEVGRMLVLHPKVKAVGFTGSIKGGRALFDYAASRPEPIPVFAEMGSINPVVFLKDSLTEKNNHWAETYAGSITLGTGQFCTNPGLIIGLKSNEFSAFSIDLANKIETIQAQCMLHPKLHTHYEHLKNETLAQTKVQLLNSTTIDSKLTSVSGTVALVDAATFIANPLLQREVFGPFSLLVQCEDYAQMEQLIDCLEGQLTGTIIGTEAELLSQIQLLEALQQKVGRLIFNGVPTGVEVCPSMTHGGPYPASTDSRFTAVGTNAIKRWVRPFSFQGFPDALLPEILKRESFTTTKRNTHEY